MDKMNVKDRKQIGNNDHHVKQNNVAVQGTNDSSIVSKASVASLGYFKDPYLCYFVSKTSRRSPLINRGYFIRARAIDDVLKAFIKQFTGKKSQIISLGAGFDSTYFRLESTGFLGDTTFYEVDFPELVKRKAALIRNTKDLLHLIHHPVFHDVPQSSALCISSLKYHLLGVDLKQLDVLQSVFEDIGVDVEVPTLLLSECVITYIDSHSADALIHWAAQTFTNGQFISYEQVLPNDAFGIVMRKHFQKLNSPLNAIEKYSTKQKHSDRFVEQHWQGSESINMYEYYTQIISSEERRRVERIELFDEFEEWHLKCIHYILVAGFNGVCNQARKDLFPHLLASPSMVGDTSPCSDLSSADHVKPIPVHTTDTAPACLRVFSHASALIPNTQKVLVTGGFGDQDGCHGRLETVQLVHFNRAIVEVEPAEISHKLGARLHHTITWLSSLECFLIFGGRTSPAKPCTTVCLLTLLESKPSYQLRRVCTGDTSPPPRWRHTATPVTVGGQEGVLVLGGRGVEATPFGDCWLLHVEDMTWCQLIFTGSVMEARHSHTATPWGSTCVVVAGGLGCDTTPLNSIEILNVQSKSSTLLETTPPFQARYSHTAHIEEDKLILLGGVQPSSDVPPSLTIINLLTHSLQQFTLQISPECPLMLHNHTSHWSPDTKRLLVIGGGGNCFSFGTHLNMTPIVIEGVVQSVSR